MVCLILSVKAASEYDVVLPTPHLYLVDTEPLGSRIRSYPLGIKSTPEISHFYAMVSQVFLGNCSRPPHPCSLSNVRNRDLTLLGRRVERRKEQKGAGVFFIYVGILASNRGVVCRFVNLQSYEGCDVSAFQVF